MVLKVVLVARGERTAVIGANFWRWIAIPNIWFVRIIWQTETRWRPGPTSSLDRHEVFRGKLEL